MTLHEFNQALSKGELTEELINQALLQGGRTAEEDEVTVEAAKYILKKDYITVASGFFERYPISIGYSGGNMVSVDYDAWIMIGVALRELKKQGKKVYKLINKYYDESGPCSIYSCQKTILQNYMNQEIMGNEVGNFRFRFGEEYIPNSKWEELSKMNMTEFKIEMEQLYKRVIIELPNQCNQSFAELLMKELDERIKNYMIIEI